jgi:hypothetical protein
VNLSLIYDRALRSARFCAGRVGHASTSKERNLVVRELDWSDDHKMWEDEPMKSLVVSATEFKAKCLALLDEVDQRGAAITVTKRGRPVATI